MSNEKKVLPTKKVTVAKPFTFKGKPVKKGDPIEVTEFQEKNQRARGLIA